MTFTVTYKDSLGRQVRERIEASSGKALQKSLDARGIRAVRIESDDGEMIPSADRRAPSRTIVRGLVAGVLVVVAALAAWFLLRPDEGIAPAGESQPRPIRDAKPATRQDVGQKDASTSAAATNVVETSTREAATLTTNGTIVTSSSGGKKNFRIVRRDPSKKRLFHTMADVQIARLINTDPGQAIIGSMNYSRFPELLEKALKTPIVIDEDDTPDEAAFKQDVIAARKDLKAAMDRGEDIAAQMQEAENELRRLYNYRENLRKEISKAKVEGRFGPSDMADYIDAANKMLKDNGIKPLSFPSFWIKNAKIREPVNEAQ